MKDSEGGFDELVRLMGLMRSDVGCPWDRQQRIDSFKEHFANEVEEVIAAIDACDYENLTEELGDLLWNILFISQIAKEEGIFTIDDVIRQLNEKMIRRHPHVFGDVEAKTVEDVLRHYKSVKAQEKAKRSPKR